MDASVRRIHWQSTYGAKDERKVGWFQDEPQPSLDLVSRFAPSLTSAIIDVGGGAARLIDHLLSRGFKNVSVLDLSENALAIAQERLGPRATSVHWLVGDATSWTPPQPFVIWHDRATFHFLTEAADRAAYLARLEQGLAPGGHVVIGTFALDGPEKCSGLPVVRYDLDTLAETLGPAFERVHTQRHVHTTPGGKPQAFQFSVFRRAS